MICKVTGLIIVRFSHAYYQAITVIYFNRVQHTALQQTFVVQPIIDNSGKSHG